jgi:hypothetical protein
MTGRGRSGISDTDDPSLGDDARWRQVAQLLHEPDGGVGLTTDIVYAVADAEGVPPREIRSPPLYEAVDVVGIETALFRRGRGDESRKGTGPVEFYYDEYLIKVRSDGWIQVFESVERADT